MLALLPADKFDLKEPPPPKAPAEQIIRNPQQAYLAICLGVKDQNEDLREWIEYHRYIGVGKFYVFDDNSTVPAASTLQDLIQEGKHCTTGQVSHAMQIHPSFRKAAFVIIMWYTGRCLCCACSLPLSWQRHAQEEQIRHAIVSLPRCWQSYGLNLLEFRLMVGGVLPWAQISLSCCPLPSAMDSDDRHACRTGGVRSCRLNSRQYHQAAAACLWHVYTALQVRASHPLAVGCSNHYLNAADCIDEMC